MSLDDALNLFTAGLVSIGGGGLVVFALSSWLLDGDCLHDGDVLKWSITCCALSGCFKHVLTKSVYLFKALRHAPP